MRVEVSELRRFTQGSYSRISRYATRVDIFLCGLTEPFMEGDYPFAVKKQLIARVVDIWRPPVSSALAGAETKFKDMLSVRVQTRFAAYSFGGLRDTVRSAEDLDVGFNICMLILYRRNIVFETLESCKFRTMEQLDFLLDQESEPSTVHEGLFKRYKSQFSGYYKDLFTPSSALSALGKVLEIGKEELLQTALGPALEAAGLKDVALEDVKRLLPLSEANQTAIEIMASTSAHFQSKWYSRYSTRRF